MFAGWAMLAAAHARGLDLSCPQFSPDETTPVEGRNNE
ncbi:Hypothetical protein BROD_1938 [Brucella sp. NF 2653]|uniref:Uncharacterized protein n=2 Tax=Brucella TaxID=234 RepID=A9M5T7_BRUC2|nr:Hypothetical protein, conserved [Brucella canis ATCC 23365]ABY38372.1 Hypothetical protein, conserved [Brucella suis ATCC 23445]EFM57190.1 Hypothetical protein BIBO1_0845 [Brucella inopinata BO1]EFM61907.1 Hypothetical protein BROD_1938 [Brucella sp. NF 2653]